MKTYESFWGTLSSAYPVSQGSLRVPIVAELQTLPGIVLSEVLTELSTVLDQLLKQTPDAKTAQQRALAAGEEAIVPYITDDYTGVVRFDCVLSPEGQVKILELNADYPDGLLLHDATYSALSDTPCRIHEKAFLSFFPPHSNIHIAHAAEASFLDAYYVEKQVLERVGHTVSIGAETPQSAGWHRRCMEVTKMSPEDISWTTGKEVVHVNTLALRTIGYKDLLAEVAHPYIPATHQCSADISELLIEHRSNYILKPANGCEGYGIYFGHEHHEASWREIVVSLPDGYIAQEYVRLPKCTVPIYDAGTITERTLYYDFCPHFFVKNGEVTGHGHVLMRFSSSPVVNVTQGGAIGYHRLPDVNNV